MPIALIIILLATAGTAVESGYPNEAGRSVAATATE
jgi:hypothetical protein